MGTSGQRPSEEQIIDNPELESPLKRWGEKILTISLWSLWAYWILPVLTAGLWYMGVRMFAVRLVDAEIVYDLLKILRGGWIIIAVIFGINMLWIYYNYRIYKKKGNRRQYANKCSMDKLSDFFHIDKALVSSASRHPRLKVRINNNGLDVSYFCNICKNEKIALENVQANKCSYERCVYNLK